MSDNLFFKNRGPFSIKKIIDTCGSKSNTEKDITVKIHNIVDLFRAKKNDITFLNSSKYKKDSLKCKATACITNKDLAKYLPQNCLKIIVAETVEKLIVAETMKNTFQIQQKTMCVSGCVFSKNATEQFRNKNRRKKKP